MYGVIAVLAALENIVPPVPADTVVALGAFLAGEGAPVTMLGVFLATWIPNVASAVGMYWVARTVGRGFVESPTGRRLLSPAAMQAIERAYQRHHVWGIFVSRFLPGYRAVVPPFAGIAGLGAVRALAPVAVASGIWYGFLVLLAHRLGSNWDGVERAIGRVGWWLGLVALAVSAALVVAVLLRRRRRSRVQP
ncbi:MAG TPA: DedA family protein [Gemmatimonadales bacterium]|nr:DedA family protein [Gemmatimonadales bacterium]